ncbi:glycerophosphodiester phosphodiesterase, partial [Sphingopyxis sp.]|uniref:glycerophosphodiester phosphodiesterase n=1 Tax=Sphingopyxis sp. TaxID=1908224 RepID=UPI002ED90F53
MTRIARSYHARRLLTAGIAAGALAFLPVGAFAQDAPAADPARDHPPIAIIAHRGGALLRPENTMPAFRHAATLGVEYLEFDMEMTADDRVVVYHDATINPDFCKSG